MTLLFNFCSTITDDPKISPPTECDINNFLEKKFGQWTSFINATYSSPILEPVQPKTLPPEDGFSFMAQQISNGECLDVNQQSISDPINERSICPWSLKRNYDPRRLPSLLFEAVCQCKKAKNGRNTACAKNYECEPVVYEMRVLRFDPTCSWYKATFEDLVIACVPVVRPAQESVKNFRSNEIQVSWKSVDWLTNRTKQRTNWYLWVSFFKWFFNKTLSIQVMFITKINWVNKWQTSDANNAVFRYGQKRTNLLIISPSSIIFYLRRTLCRRVLSQLL